MISFFIKNNKIAISAENESSAKISDASQINLQVGSSKHSSFGPAMLTLSCTLLYLVFYFLSWSLYFKFMEKIISSASAFKLNVLLLSIKLQK